MGAAWQTAGLMRLGVVMLPTDPWPETVARARRLEALGYDHLWTYDHLSWRRYRDQPWHATIPWLTGVAAATERVRIGPLVSSPNFRHPVTLAKDAMTLDHVSGGRFVLGVGAGGPGWDATVLGGSQPGPAERVARLGEFVEVIDGLLRNAEFSYRGAHYTVDDARMYPGCVQQPRVPLAIAAAGPRTIALAARYADMWITYGVETMADHSRRLDDACAAIGRDPATIERLYLAGSVADEGVLASVEGFGDFSGRAAALGFTDLVFHHPRPDDPVWTEPEAIIEQIAENFAQRG